MIYICNFCNKEFKTQKSLNYHLRSCNNPNNSYNKDCNCRYCNKLFKTITGKNGHEPYCKMNPNKIYAWNKGLTKETSEIVKQYSENGKITKNDIDFKELHPIWNKGLTKETSESVKKNAENMSKTKRTSEYKEKVIQHNREKYGVDYPQQSEIIKQQCIENNRKKFGVDWPVQLSEIVDKILKKRYKHKEYILPSGNKIFLQGYEPYVLDILLTEFNECDICCGTKIDEKFIYIDDNNKTHRYYPDIYVKSINTIIEVKSEYTINDNKKLNMLKYKSVIDKNYNYQCWIMYKNGTIKEKIDDLCEFYSRYKKS